jgi:mandelamide amidase
MPGLVLPAGVTSDRLPVGLAFDMLPGQDRELLSLGLSIEQAFGPIEPPQIDR